jgi:hypothetical protein
MRSFRRLPPLLRVVSLLGLLFPLASLALLVPVLVTSLRSFPQVLPEVDREVVSREVVIALILGLLGMTCTFAVNTYSTRFRRPDRGPLALGSWQSRVRAIVLVVALLVFALALALVATLIPLPLNFMLMLLAAAVVSALAAAVLLVAWATVGAKVRD